MAKREKPNVPHPSSEQVEHYLRAWDELENYHLQEDALDKLFFTLCPENSDMSDILLKVAALNDFTVQISSCISGGKAYLIVEH